MERNENPGTLYRLAAAVIDCALIFYLARIFMPQLGYVLDRLSRDMLHVGSPDTIWKGPVAMAISIFSPLLCSFYPAAIFFSF